MDVQTLARRAAALTPRNDGRHSALTLLEVHRHDGQFEFVGWFEGHRFEGHRSRRSLLGAIARRLDALEAPTARVSSDGVLRTDLAEALFQAFVVAGYDRDGSHAAGEYTGYRYGLGINAEFLADCGLVEPLAEEMLRIAGRQVTPADVEAVLAVTVDEEGETRSLAAPPTGETGARKLARTLAERLAP
jgi:hypothetical protein